MGLELISSSLVRPESLAVLLFRFAVNLTVILVLLKRLDPRLIGIKNYPFILFIFNVMVFFFASFLGMINIDFNFAFGLFAVFALLRYRTQQIPIFEMTFLFISIIVAIINSTVTINISLVELFLANIIILFSCSLTELFWKPDRIEYQDITYEKIDMITPENADALKADLIERTGLPIYRVAIKKINFLNDTAAIRAYYGEPNIGPVDALEEDENED